MMGELPQVSSATALLSRRWFRVVLLVSVWTFIGILIATLSHLRMSYIGQESHYWKWLIDSIVGWNIWAVLTPIIIWLGRKIRIEREHVLSSSLQHIPLAIGVVTIRAMHGMLVSMLVMGESITFATYGDQLLRYLIWMSPWDLVIYAGILGFSYAVDYRKRLRDRELESVRLEAALSKAQLDALHAQLQPHFLFNTLNSISVLMQTDRVDTADRMLRRLSELLRYILAKGNMQEVTLEEEMQFVSGYLDIERTRFGARLCTKIDVPRELLTALVPSFVLQTLVENAIRHGVGPKTEVGTVSITFTQANSNLRIQVSDDGVGLSDESKSKMGVGLQNTRARLRRLYGEDQQFEISSGPSGGTVALLVIPYRREE